MILAVLQARVSSSRLPGKVLLPILGAPMLLRQIQRVRRSHRIDRLVVATSEQPSDDPIGSLCREHDVECFRGSLDDVLDRFYRAAQRHAPSHVVRLTGDCPLCDPAVIDEVIAFHLHGGYDYASNALHPTFPDGLDVEVARFEVLEMAWREANLPSEREHVMPFIHKRPERFRLGNYEHDPDLSRLRWSVDEPQDYEFVCRVYEALHPAKPEFGMRDVLDLLARHPELGRINADFERNEGYQKSLARDARILERKNNG